MKKLCLFFCLLTCNMLSAKTGIEQHHAQLRTIIEELLRGNGYSYRYVVNARFPDGTAQQLKGEMYVNKAAGLIYNSNSMQTVIANKNWYYRADHNKKQVVITATAAVKGKSKQPLLKNVTPAPTMSELFIDSELLTYSHIDVYNKVGNVITVELSFPKGGMMKNMKLVYDVKTKIPVMCSYTISYKMPSRSPGNQMVQTFYCDKYTKVKDDKMYELPSFFTVTGGKAELKKYTNYRLTTRM